MALVQSNGDLTFSVANEVDFEKGSSWQCKGELANVVLFENDWNNNFMYCRSLI